MAEQGAALELQSFEEIVVVQRQIVDIANVVQLLEIVEAGREGSQDGMLFREAVDNRLVCLHADESVQPYEWCAAAGAVDNLAAPLR